MCYQVPQIQLKAEEIAKKLKNNLVHQRSEVRNAALKAVWHLILRGGLLALEDIGNIMKNLAVDAASAVRETVLGACTVWLMELKDDSFEHIYTECMLHLLSDELVALRYGALQGIEKAGALYEQYNEEKVTELKDYPMEDAIDNSDIYLEPIKQRPSLGARLFVTKHAKKIIGHAMDSLLDWSVSTRANAAKLLQQVLIFAEKDVTPVVNKILAGLFSTTKDDDVEVRKQVRFCNKTNILQLIRCAFILGRVVDPAAYLKFVFVNTKPEFASSPHLLANEMSVLKHLVSGSTREALREYFSPQEVQGVLITRELGMPHLVYHDSLDLKREILSVIEVLVEKAHNDIASCGLQYVLLILRMTSNCAPLREKVCLALFCHIEQ